MSKRQKNPKGPKELKTSTMSDTESLEQQEKITMETVPTSTPSKGKLKPPPSSPESNEPALSDLEESLQMKIDSHERCKTMLQDTEDEITALAEIKLPSDNPDVAKACESVTECRDKMAKLRKQQAAHKKARVKLSRDMKPKAKESLNVSVAKASSSTPAMTPISPTT